MNFNDYIDNLDSLLKIRFNKYPIQDEDAAKLQNAIKEFVDYLLNNIDTNSIRSFKEDDLEGLGFLSNPVFVCGSQKSGTSLLTQLLDGHDDLIVMPGDSFLWQQMSTACLSFDFKRFNWDSSEEQLRNLYRKIVVRHQEV